MTWFVSKPALDLHNLPGLSNLVPDPEPILFPCELELQDFLLISNRQILGLKSEANAEVPETAVPQVSCKMPNFRAEKMCL